MREVQARACALVAVAIVAIMVAVSGASAAVTTVATLSPASTQGAFDWVTASGRVAVAWGNETDVFTEPADGWASETPAATLEDPTSDANPAPVSLSGPVAVTGVTGPDSGDVDVFVEPAGGWSGAAIPAARLEVPNGLALSGAVVSGNTVAALASTSLGSRAKIEVFVEPSHGWSGVVMPAATLQDSDHAQIVGTAISDGVIVGLAGSGRADVFSEPAAGWSGAMTESAHLLSRPGVNGAANPFTGSIAIAGRQIVAGQALFAEPTGGWSGDVRASATLFPARSLPGPGSEDFSGGLAAMTSSRLGAEHNCPCRGDLSLFSEPATGWHGTISAPPALATEISSGALSVALDGSTLFITGGGNVDVDQITGSYGSKPGAPNLGKPSLTGLTDRRPQLTFSLAAGINAPPVLLIRLRLPKGLSFSAAPQRLSRGVYVRGITNNRVAVQHQALTISLGAFLAKKTSIGVRAVAFNESPGLRRAAVRAERRHRELSERLTIESTDSLGETSTRAFSVRTP
jgi:hypothetical protein